MEGSAPGHITNVQQPSDEAYLFRRQLLRRHPHRYRWRPPIWQYRIPRSLSGTNLYVNALFATFSLFRNIELHSSMDHIGQVICKTALNTNVECQRDPQNHFLHALRHFFKAGSSRFIDVAVYFPVVKTIISRISPCGQFTQSIVDKVQRRLQSIHQSSSFLVNVFIRFAIFCTQVQHAIDQHRHNGESVNDKMKHIDMLTLLLDSAAGGSSDDDSHPLDTFHRLNPRRRIHYLLSDEEIVANAWVFLLGGFETTANTLTYCCYLLAKHPDIQQRVYEEIAQHVQVFHIPLTPKSYLRSICEIY